MFHLAADVPPSARSDYARRARAIVAGMRAGHVLEAAAGTHRIADRLEIRVPASFRFTCEDVPTRLTTCGLRHLRTIGSRSLGMVLLQLVPASQLRIPPPPGGTSVSETILGRTVPWISHRGEDLVLRTTVPLDEERRLQILVSSPDDAAQRALLSIVQTLRLLR